MKCPKCIKEDKRSVVTQGASMVEAIHIPTQWDSKGRRIISAKHAKTRTAYSCSEGHSWTEVE